MRVAWPIRRYSYLENKCSCSLQCTTLVPCCQACSIVVIALLACSPLPAEALFSSVAQQEVKVEVKVEVKDHLRAGDFEGASCYTQSRQDS